MNKQVKLWLGLVVLSTMIAGCQIPKSGNTVVKPAPLYKASNWQTLPEWNTTNLTPAWSALLQSCRVLKNKPQWQSICNETNLVDGSDNEAQRKFYEEKLVPFQLINQDGTENGVITGYYEPLVKGSRVKDGRFVHPLYGVPDDMLDIDLADVYPQLKGMRLRGRVSGKKVLPYFNRAEIDAGPEGLKGRELFWIDNAVELFFLQIQGSGRIELPDGQQIKVGYANQNGHPYVPIGKKLVEMGEMKIEEASMQSIKAWGERNPDKLTALLEMNPSYVFFRELPENLSAPLGALGVPLTNEYSIAVDPRNVPLGSPVFLATTQPNSETPLNRLMLAQDTGGAIRGNVRADFFWGFGEKAGAQAGRMKQQGKMWVLFPKGAEPVQD